ncbi:MAG: exodeoxyribonuclease VII small subunit [Clostridia bacterium]|nr:exodeoxyribonuclease VII small subunit [Clostridia bacterium]
MKLEDNMKRLEEIAQTLDSGEQSLEECLKLYEEGVKLAKTCLEDLEKTKGKITEIKESTNMEEDIDA